MFSGKQNRLAGLFFLTLLLFRLFWDWQLGAKFRPGQGVRLNFCLSSQPYYQEDKQILFYQNHFQRVKITLPAEPKLDFGDCLGVEGRIKRCSNKEICLDHSQPVPFKEELRIRFLGGVILKRLRALRRRLAGVFLRSLPYPEADLLSGIVLGVKQNLDPDFYQQLRVTGTLHIIVASGYNLSVTGERPVSFLAYFIGRKPSLVVGFLLVWLYVGLVGFEPPVVRAGIMLSFVFLAQFAGRRFDQFRALAAAIWLMLLAKPDLITSISFQLSVAALTGIILGGSVFNKLARLPLAGENLAETLSAQIMVAPLIAWHFGRLSSLAPLTNILILPWIPLIMNLGLLALLLGWTPFTSQLILWLVYPFLAWAVFVVRTFARLPLSEISLRISWWQLILVYSVVLWLFLKKRRGEKE